MKYEDSALARQSAAIRLMQRVEAMKRQERAVVVAMPNDGPPNPAERCQTIHEVEEDEAFKLAMRGPLKAIGAQQANRFGLARVAGNCGSPITRRVIIRMIDKGLMRWINSARTAVELVDPPPRDENWRTKPRPTKYRVARAMGDDGE